MQSVLDGDEECDNDGVSLMCTLKKCTFKCLGQLVWISILRTPDPRTKNFLVQFLKAAFYGSFGRFFVC